MLQKLADDLARQMGWVQAELSAEPESASHPSPLPEGGDAMRILEKYADLKGATESIIDWIFQVGTQDRGRPYLPPG